MRTLSKPAGVPVFAPHADPGGACVLADLLAREPWRRDVVWPEGFDGGIAHRLDVSTSGALWVADDPEELAVMRRLFETKALVKTYRFQTDRTVPWAENACDAPIAHDKRKRGRMIVQRGQNTPHRGKWYPAHTEFLHLAGPVWQATMRSGVMHQIRAHAAFVGLALLGDRVYGGRSEGDGGFLLHHVGLVGPGVATDPVPLPDWASVKGG